MMGLFDLLDEGLANELGVDVKTYIEIIDMRASEEDAQFIIMTLLGDNESEKEKAKELFKSYMPEDGEQGGRLFLSDEVDPREFKSIL